ncbi:acyltransferase [Methylocystis parvus]|uniref:Acyltransferase n=1 Tax=Methylocystis parvus TaxID=134 RepID=A0A6B8M224_9HYPH|nr:acyltransferase [Methylocystis parvus]
MSGARGRRGRQTADLAEQPRFCVDAVKEIAGKQVFERGEAYHRAGKVVLMSVDQSRVAAQVSGSEIYRTVVTGRGAAIGGECSCPAFEQFGFCKHMAAVALAANATNEEGFLERIRVYLRTQSADALIDLVLSSCVRDPALFRQLEAACVAATGDEAEIRTKLRRSIDRAVQTSGFVDYGGTRAWAADVEEVLTAVAALIDVGRSSLALGLAEHAIDRIEGALPNIDDSEGYCGSLSIFARDVHLAAARASKPEPREFARMLFAREMESDLGAFDGAAALYEEVLGEAGLSEYRRLAEERWAKLPALTGAMRGEKAYSDDYRRIEDILDYFAERDGDVDARLALRAKDLSTPWRYLRLVEFCVAHGLRDEALRRAEEGLWIFEDGRQDDRLVSLAADLLEQSGRKSDAEATLWRGFEKAPGREFYESLRRLGGEEARERALRALEDSLEKPSVGRSRGVVDLLVETLVKERLFTRAWAAVHRHKVSAATEGALARASEASHAGEALKFYVRRVDSLVEAGGAGPYSEAASLIRRMAALRSDTEHLSYLSEIKTRYARRRNFIKLLDADSRAVERR